MAFLDETTEQEVEKNKAIRGCSHSTIGLSTGIPMEELGQGLKEFETP